MPTMEGAVMGLFDRFRNNKKQEQAVRQSLGQGGYEASASSHQNNNPSDNESQAMRTIYALSKFCGSVMLFTGTREEAAMPNFFQFCYRIQSSYRWTIMLLCNKEGETPSGLYISPRFKDYMDCDGGDLNTYLSNCGVIAYQEEYERCGGQVSFSDGKMEISLNLEVQFQTMIDTAKMAFVQALLLYRETQDSVFRDWIKNDVLSDLLFVNLMLQMNITHIFNQKTLMFISRSLLEGEMGINLDFIDPISPNQRLMTYPMILNCLMFIPNEDGAVATGAANVCGQQGVILQADDEGAEAIVTLTNRTMAKL